MIISPITAIEQGWVTYPDCNSVEDWKQRKFLSPNAIDFTVDQIQRVLPGKFSISEDHKKMRSQTGNLLAYAGGTDWFLEQGVYDISSDMYVKLPDKVAAMIVTRSTFVRNGCFIQSGLYDQGFNGHIGAVLFNPFGNTQITPHTRIGQIIFVSSEDGGTMYAGGYNTAQGSHWTEKQQGTTVYE
jgi:deoxycytidine triphosphate deaminase